MAFSKTQFQQHKFAYETFALVAYFAINATINATTVLMEELRKTQASFHSWEPFAWEYSSALASLIIIPLIAWLTRRYPWNWRAGIQSLVLYSCAAIAYSLLHVSLMVTVRELAYLLSASDYQFANSFPELTFEILYEARKDIWSFCFFIAMIAIYRYLISQWLGDVSSVSDNTDEGSNEELSEALASILLVKKLGKEFLIKSQQIEWAEACGNYANLHIGEDVYPMRITMSDFVEKGTHLGFARVHKSYAINVNRVHYIEALPSGDAEVVMLSGNKVKLSRRYKKDFDEFIAGL